MHSGLKSKAETGRRTPKVVRRTLAAFLLTIAAGASGLCLRAEDSVKELLDMKFPTLGGKQLWADMHFLHDWRIQRYALTDHYRLLDPNNKLEKLGSLDACRARLDEIRAKEELPPMSGRAVVVLHGLGRSRSAMARISEMLRTKGNYLVFNVGYPTLLGDVGQHAQTLDSVIRSLEDVDEINFVCHSLGNLVVRRWLSDTRDEATGEPRESGRLGRMVMLGPPNHRPELAGKVGQLKIAMTIGGKAFRELAEGWDTLAPTLMTPPIEFGILAGGRGNEQGYNPFVPGDDDAIVSVESTRLAGARDFRVLPVAHTFMMNDAKVHEYTLHFLEQGCFESEDARQAIEADKSRESRD